MPLVVVRSAPVLREIEGIDRRAEEELADVVHRLRRACTRRGTGPTRAGRCSERQVQAVVVGVARRRILAVVARSRDSGRQPLLVPAATQRRHVLVDRHQQVAPAHVLIADADRAARGQSAARLRRSPGASTRSAGRGSIVVRLGSVTDGTTPLRMLGKTGAPACAGDRLTLHLPQVMSDRSCCRPTAARWPARGAARDRRTARHCRGRSCGASRTATTRSRAAARRCSRRC